MTKRAYISNIQHFSTEDGSGVRTTVFFMGCNMHCFWCHNPETLALLPRPMLFKSLCVNCGICQTVCRGKNAKEIMYTASCSGCGECAKECPSGAIEMTGCEMDAKSVLNEILFDREIYEISSGGVTFSGGEPLLAADFLLEILPVLIKNGINAAIETALFVDYEKIERVLPYVDTFYCDIKAIDEEKHKAATGVSNKLILENVIRLSKSGARVVVRVPIVSGFNDKAEAEKIAGFVAGLENAPEVELLPFHKKAIGKYKALKKPYEAESLDEISDSEAERILNVFLGQGLKCRRRGS